MTTRGHNHGLLLFGLLALASLRLIDGAEPCTGTVMDLLQSTPGIADTATWVRQAGYGAVLDAPFLNLTVFAPPDEELAKYLPTYTGVPLDPTNPLSVSPAVALYNSLEGAYTQDQLLEAGSVNSVLGLLINFDIPLTFSKDPDGNGVLISDMTGDPDKKARILSGQKSCNGWLYTVDRLLLPANRTEQISPFDDGASVQIFLNSSNCGPRVAEDVISLGAPPYVTAFLEQTGLLDRLANASTAVTLLLPFNIFTSAVSEPVLPVALYNMIPGAYCPSTLVSLKEVNSMLGAIQGEELPLAFSQGADGVLRVAGLDGASVAVLDSIVVCKSVILVTDSALVPPQVDAASLSIPENLPTLPDRHLTCRPPVYNGTSSESYADGGAILAPPSGENETNIGLIVGLSVGLSCAALLAAVAGWWWVRRRRTAVGTIAKKSTSSTKDISVGHVPLDSVTARYQSKSSTIPLSAVVNDTVVVAPKQLASTPPTSSASSASADSSPFLGDWEIEPSDLTIDATDIGKPILLGRGSFGNVYKGMLREVQPVAVKVLPNAGAAAARAFRQEAEILRRVNRDRNIVQLYGVARLHDSFVLVMELMEGGDLLDALAEHTAGELSWPRFGKAIALDITRGLIALHACNVIHRDLKSKNVLLTAGGTGGAPRAKLADVGVATIATHEYITPQPGAFSVGTLAWTAPEMLLAERCSSKVDIFSLGIVLWEISTGQVPQRGFIRMPEPSEQCPKELVELISSCVHSDPSQRPTAKQVYEKLLSIPPQEVV